jgi:YhcH/YjgK/YiaL family protein
MKNIKYLAILFVLVIAGKLAQAQKQDSIAANKWVKSKVWAKDLKIKADPSINATEFKRQYEGNKELWDKVFKFLGDPKLATLAPGKYVIDGDNAYATIAEGAPKKLEDVKWESHRKYIDLQYVVAGKVKIGVAPVSSATVTMPYDETKDIANYTAEGTFFTATPEAFFLFFPQNAHRPDIKVDGYDTLKKLVIKIRYKE